VSNPGGIACGDDCTHSFVTGASVALTASADPGSEFLQWLGAAADCGTDTVCNLLITGDQAVSVQFEVEQTLTVNLTGSGSGHVGSNDTEIDCGIDCVGAYPRGSTEVLTAAPEQGSALAGWGEDAEHCGRQLDCEVTIDAEKLVSARFEPAQTLTVTGTNSGKVVTDPKGIDCPGGCAGAFVKDEEVILIAIPAASFEFNNWGGDCSGEDPVTSVVLSRDMTCTTNFILSETVFENSFE
jgi:hypothetical protein